MPPPSIIEVILSMKNVGAFVSQAGEASKATTGVGTSAEVAGKKAGRGALGLLKYAAGATAIYGAVRFIDKAVTSTEDLAKATYRFQKQTGAGSEFASEWLSATEEMGISAQQTSVSFQTLSKQIAKASGGGSDAAKKIADLRHQIDLVSAAGGKDAPKQLAKLSKGITTAQAQSVKARKLFDSLGVSQKDLAKGNTPAVMLQVADAFKTMKDPAKRAADAQLLFGRSGYKLLPVLTKGREGIKKWLEAQREAGNYLTQKQVQANLKAVKQQKELSAAMHGLSVQLALALLPVLIQVGQVLMRFAKLLQPITSNSTRLKVVIYGVVAAFTAYKVVTIALTLWSKRLTVAKRIETIQTKLLAAATWVQAAASKAAALAAKAWAAAQWLLNLAVDAFPILLIVAGVVALGVAFYEAYKRVGWFHRAVDTAWHAILAGAQLVWRWVKTNWPLLLGVLLGPFGIAAALIVTHWKQVRDFVGAVWSVIVSGAGRVVGWFRANWPYLVGVLLGPFGLAAAAIYKHFGAIKNFALGIVAAVRTAIQNLVSWVETLPGKLGHILRKVPGVGLALKAGGAAAGLAKKAFGQYGGAVARPGSFVVGERGPELVSLPAGALVRPTPDTASVGHGRELVITVPVMLDRREIARSVARVASDQLARR
jgi:hypothetical protein